MVVKKYIPKKLDQIANETGLVGELIHADAAQAIIESWWDMFAGDGAKSSWKKARLFWHCFSFGCKPSLAFTPATKAYEAQSNKSIVYLFSGEKRPLAIKTSKRSLSSAVLDALIENSNSIIDLYVVDHEFGWTYVRTHEECTGLGPFYSEKVWGR